MKPIRVNSGFATPYDTARILGVSKARTEELIKMVRVRADRAVTGVPGKNGASPDTDSKIRPRIKSLSSTSSAARKSLVRNSGSRLSATKTKTAKANR
jgi:hypothetical protein